MPGQRRTPEGSPGRSQDGRPAGARQSGFAGGAPWVGAGVVVVAVGTLILGAAGSGPSSTLLLTVVAAGAAALAFAGCQLHALRRNGPLLPADTVTMLRAVLLGLLTGHLVHGLPGPSLSWWAVATAAIMLLLDAAVVLVLSAAAATLWGGWVLLIGLLDPSFRLGRRLRPR